MMSRRLRPFPRAHCLTLLALALVSVPVAAQEDHPGEFPEIYNTQELGTERLWSPEEALASFRLPEGFQAQLFAAEPDVQQPIAMTFDARGRLWVVENYTYAEHKTNFAQDLRDRIVVLEDTDHDGRADQRRVFWDQGQKLTSIEVGLDGVWVLAAPQLLFLPDRDHDDRPDGPPEVVLDGWNADAVRHNIVNGLRWGPDGWLYGRHGILATSYVGLPGTSPDRRQAINCGIWRYHPTRQTFEVVAQGTTNPWGTDWDEHGELFFSNTVIGHLWHVVPGAHFERMYGEDLVPNLYSLLPQVGDHVHWNPAEVWSDVRKGVTSATAEAGGGHAHCGLLIYQGDNWPAEYRGQAFMINLHGRRLNRDKLAANGTTYTATHEPDFLFVGDPWFRGIDLLTAPDGSVYIADWSDTGECHENDGVHRTSGRIYRVAYGTPRADGPGDLRRLPPVQLVSLLSHANDWYPRQVRLELQRRAESGADLSAARQRLLELYQAAPDSRTRLRAMWSLQAAQAASDAWLLDQLAHRDPHVRRWAVRLLADQGPLGDDVSRALVAQAATEGEAGVLLALACALPRVSPGQFWPLATALAQHGELDADRYYAHLLWYHVSAKCADASQSARDLARTSRLSFLRRSLARRLAQDQELFAAELDGLAQHLAATSDVAWHRDILGGWQSGLAGRRQAPAPASWAAASARVFGLGDAESLAMLRELSVVFGDGRAVQEVLQVARDGQAELAMRRQALQVLVASRVPEVQPALTELLGHRDLGPDAVRGLAALGGEATGDLLLSRYSGLSPAAKAEVIQALVARRPLARQLLSAIEQGQIDRGQVSAFQIRQLRTLNDQDLEARVLKLWPEVAETAQALEEKLARYTELLTPDALARGNPQEGQILFARACASCHKLFGQGGGIGPELTGAQRGNLRYLLENILEPSAQVGENFRLSTLVMADGRVISGIVGPQTSATLTVQTPTEKFVLARDEIEELIPSQLSLMPEHLLNPLRPAEVVDLFAYLMSSPPKPAASGGGP